MARKKGAKVRITYTRLNTLRRRIFSEVARLSYDDTDFSEFNELPYEIINSETGSFRDDVFLERAIVGERIRLAMGLPLRKANEHAPVSKGIEEAARPEKFYEPPLVNVIKFACNGCPDNMVHVTDACQGCLSHPCEEVCPKHAITFKNHKSHIDQSLCIKCGRCIKECPYGAILREERPCAKACGMDAIKSDEYGKAEIDYDKCVSCGMCLVNCPFGAIADKSQIYQLIQAIKGPQPVYAVVAPSIAGQFGPKCTPDKLRPLFRELGFAGVYQVSIGADLCTVQEAKEFLESVPEKQPFMATSCCPAWAMMGKKLFPKQAPYISMALTPMVFTARLLKKKFEDQDIRVCFVGPCAAKKLEASRRSIRSHVDFVVTYEELAGMIEAKKIDFAALPDEPWDSKASSVGEGFAQSGGVAAAVVEAAKHLEPEREVKVQAAEGLADCRKMLTMAKSGKLNGYLLEGMACPGGCIAGAGTLLSPQKAKAALANAKKAAPFESALDTEYIGYRKDLEKEKEDFGKED